MTETKVVITHSQPEPMTPIAHDSAITADEVIWLSLLTIFVFGWLIVSARGKR